MKQWVVDYSVRLPEGGIQEESICIEAASIEEALVKAECRMVELEEAGIAKDTAVWGIGIVGEPDDDECVF